MLSGVHSVASSPASSSSSRRAATTGSSPGTSSSPAGSSTNRRFEGWRYCRSTITCSVSPESSTARITTAPGCSTTTRPNTSSGWPGRLISSRRTAKGADAAPDVLGRVDGPVLGLVGPGRGAVHAVTLPPAGAADAAPHRGRVTLCHLRTVVRRLPGPRGRRRPGRRAPAGSAAPGRSSRTSASSARPVPGTTWVPVTRSSSTVAVRVYDGVTEAKLTTRRTYVPRDRVGQLGQLLLPRRVARGRHLHQLAALLAVDLEVEVVRGGPVERHLQAVGAGLDVGRGQRERVVDGPVGRGSARPRRSGCASRPPRRSRPRDAPRPVGWRG